jgi:transposase
LSQKTFEIVTHVPDPFRHPSSRSVQDTIMHLVAKKISSDLVWKEIEKRSFAVLSYVNPKGRARSG